MGWALLTNYCCHYVISVMHSILLLMLLRLKQAFLLLLPFPNTSLLLDHETAPSALNQWSSPLREQIFQSCCFFYPSGWGFHNTKRQAQAGKSPICTFKILPTFSIVTWWTKKLQKLLFSSRRMGTNFQSLLILPLLLPLPKLKIMLDLKLICHCDFACYYCCCFCCKYFYHYQYFYTKHASTYFT